MSPVSNARCRAHCGTVTDVPGSRVSDWSRYRDCSSTEAPAQGCWTARDWTAASELAPDRRWRGGAPETAYKSRRDGHYPSTRRSCWSKTLLTLGPQPGLRPLHPAASSDGRASRPGRLRAIVAMMLATSDLDLAVRFTQAFLALRHFARMAREADRGVPIGPLCVRLRAVSVVGQQTSRDLLDYPPPPACLRASARLFVAGAQGHRDRAEPAADRLAGRPSPGRSILR